MLTGGAFHQCDNAQAVVDADHQVIVATDVNTNAADVGNLIPMAQQATANTGWAPDELLADAGYCSTDNLDAAAHYTAEHDTQFYIATGRRDDPPPVAPRGRIPNDATTKQRMARKLATKKATRFTPAARRSWNRSSARWRPCKTPNNSCFAGSTPPRANGSCSPPATTYANCTATSK
jgi:hypothetical protein